MMRAREITSRLKGKIDPDLLIVLEALAEDASAMRQRLRAIEDTVSQLINIVSDFVTIADNMKRALRSPLSEDDRHGPVTS